MGWPAYLQGSVTKVFLALLGMRIQRGLSPKRSFTFFFAQLEQRSGVSRSHLREHLEDLKRTGLLEELVIGTAWNSGVRRRTRIKIAAPIPDPQQLGLKQLKSS